MKIGILYICTGKYEIFWKEFYLSCEKYFIPEAEKRYFVFTDSPEIEFERENKNVARIYQENLGWPDNTLKRYDIFLKSRKFIEKMDYLFFFNANLLFLEKITAEEFLPHNQEKIVGCIHPGYYKKPVSKYTYENNPLSKAFIDRKDGMYYFAGGINGGETETFLNVMETLNDNINEDFKNRIIATWHDESHWNWYLNNNTNIVKKLPPTYLCPQELTLPPKPKILIRDKRNYGGFAKLRGNFDLKIYLQPVKFKLVKFLKSILG